MLTILKPWLHEEWQYFRKGSQWLVAYSNTWEKEVKERCEKIGFIVRANVVKGHYYICEVTEHTKILDIRKLQAFTGVCKVAPNWMIRTADLAYKQTVADERRIALRSKNAAVVKGGTPRCAWNKTDYPHNYM